MTRREEYAIDHKLAKVIVCAIVITLLLVNESGGRLLDILAVVVWFFGINPTQYCIETFMKHKHKIEWW